MENDEVNLYWPVPIGSFFNKDHSNLKKGLLAFFENYIKENPSGRKSTENQDLYESNYDIHKLKNESFDKLIGFLCGSVGKTAHAANKGLIKNVEKRNFNIYVKDSWFIKYQPSKGFVLPHYHGACSWCCVYYVQIGKDGGIENGSTYFQMPNPSSRQTYDYGSLYRDYAIKKFAPNEGSALVWPNDIYHGSIPYKGEKERIIVSANFQMYELNKEDKPILTLS